MEIAKPAKPAKPICLLIELAADSLSVPAIVEFLPQMTFC
jgi:hypothetical protein